MKIRMIKEDEIVVNKNELANVVASLIDWINSTNRHMLKNDDISNRAEIKELSKDLDKAATEIANWWLGLE